MTQLFSRSVFWKTKGEKLKLIWQRIPSTGRLNLPSVKKTIMLDIVNGVYYISCYSSSCLFDSPTTRILPVEMKDLERYWESEEQPYFSKCSKCLSFPVFQRSYFQLTGCSFQPPKTFLETEFRNYACCIKTVVGETFITRVWVAANSNYTYDIINYRYWTS